MVADDACCVVVIIARDVSRGQATLLTALWWSGRTEVGVPA